MAELYPQHIKDFIIANNQNKSLIEITDLINSNFNTNYTYTQIKRLRAKLKIISGITGRFEKGHIPHNLGKKGFAPPEFYAQQFPKGHIPYNKAEIGEERITTDGYVVVKIAQPNIWRRKHILEWEKHHGKIPPGNTIVFLDGDRTNCNIENLTICSRQTHLIMNKNQLRTTDPKLTETGILIARVTEQLNKRQKGK